MPKTIIVTGGAGFIGSHFIRHILNKYPDYQIINLDKLTYSGNIDNLRDVEHNSRYKFIKGDICDENLVNKISLEEKPDTIVNFAAESHVDRSISAPHPFIKTNILGTYVLLEAAKKYKFKKFLQISTDEIYGSIERGSFKESDAPTPSSPYSASKAAADMLVSSYFKTHNLSGNIVRCSNNFGPYQYPEKLIPLFITNLLENKKIPLYGDGLYVRQWLYVLDCCDAVDLILHNGKTGEIYNVGGEDEKTNLEISRFILKEIGKGEEYIEYVKDRPCHDRRYSLDCSKIKRTLGWQPNFNFEKVFRDTILWYQKNQWWWRKIKSGEYLRWYKKQYNL